MDRWMEEQMEKMNEEMNRGPTRCQELGGHFYINYLSAYNVEKQHAGAHKEVTPQIICKHLLIKSPARGAAFRKRI